MFLFVVACGSEIGHLTLGDDDGQTVVLRKIFGLEREEVLLHNEELRDL